MHEQRKSGFPEGGPAKPRDLCAKVGVLAALCAALVFSPRDALAERDYLATSDDWNGLGDLVALGRDIGVAVEAPAHVDLDTLRSGDTLLLVYPTQPLPRAELVAFLRRGGNVALADDFGTGGTLLEAFEIGRHAPKTAGPSRRLRGNRNVVVATPRASHPLTRDVRALVANHPQVLHHPSLPPIVAIGEGHGALVLVGAVGEGRFVAIGDASVLINNMLEFRDNRKFAENLLRYLGRDGRVVLASGDTAVAGDPAESMLAVERMRASLERLARIRLPPAALMATTIAIAALLVIAVGMAFPRRSAYLRSTRIVTPLPAGSADDAEADA